MWASNYICYLYTNVVYSITHTLQLQERLRSSNIEFHIRTISATRALSYNLTRASAILLHTGVQLFYINNLLVECEII